MSQRFFWCVFLLKAVLLHTKIGRERMGFCDEQKKKMGRKLFPSRAAAVLRERLALFRAKFVRRATRFTFFRVFYFLLRALLASISVRFECVCVRARSLLRLLAAPALPAKVRQKGECANPLLVWCKHFCIIICHHCP